MTDEQALAFGAGMTALLIAPWVCLGLVVLGLALGALYFITRRERRAAHAETRAGPTGS